MGDYILEAMQHHGLGHLPQPDNFTTCGRLGIEVNQYNNPIECYSDDTIEDMREEKVILDHPELADKVIKGNADKHQEQNRAKMNPVAAQKLQHFVPKRAQSSCPSMPRKRSQAFKCQKRRLNVECMSEKEFL